MDTFIRKSLLQLIFSGAYILRWNDKLRPMELVEIDKQAHKMLISCILWQQAALEIQDPKDRQNLATNIIEGALFDYFYRLIITDIKPPVFYRIKENAEDYKQLTEHVLDQLQPCFGVSLDDIEPQKHFFARMCAWHRHPHNSSLAARILQAAHLYASQWEFKLLAPLNSFDDEIKDIAASFTEKLDALKDLPGMRDILDPHTSLGKFANICGQLRFQVRWTSAPRLPATSVLGHMFIVAVFSYLFSLQLAACQTRCNNNFYCGLFHDLPELLTRDIISPVKLSVPNLPQIIKKYENDELERRILQPLRADGFTALVERISFYLGLSVGSEFKECCRVDGQIKAIKDFETLQQQYNADALDPKDGFLIKICDWLAAFLEAHNSIRIGVSSPQLLEARSRLKENLLKKTLASLKVETLLADYD
ncbi:MAG: HD domain-containing protein [Desulfovibrionaceae bacterium]|nr:HD domain-containing protein [Desulfovibrionaceae bacterium]